MAARTAAPSTAGQSFCEASRLAETDCRQGADRQRIRRYLGRSCPLSRKYPRSNGFHVIMLSALTTATRGVGLDRARLMAARHRSGRSRRPEDRDKSTGYFGMTSARRESPPNGRRSRIPFEKHCKVLDMAMRWKSQADSPKR